MNDYITKDALLSLGVDASDAEITATLNKLNEKVAEKVGDEIIESLTPDDVQTLVDMQDIASDKELGDWIVERVPDYEEIVQSTVDFVIGEYADTLPSPAA